MDKTFKFKFDSCQTRMRQNILPWHSCTQTASIKLGTGVKRSQSTQRYKKRFPSLDSWIDNLDTVMDFMHFICQFCQFHDNSSTVIFPAEPQYLTFQQGMLGNFIVFCWSLILIIITMVQGNRPNPTIAELQSHPQRILQKPENVCYKTNFDLCRIPGHATQASAGFVRYTWASAHRPFLTNQPWPG